MNDADGINVSRCFGNHNINEHRPIDAIIAKPKITVCPLKVGDICLFFSDGLTDVVEKEEIIKCINKLSVKEPNRLSRILVKSSIDNDGCDNITAVVVKIGCEDYEWDIM